MKGMLMSDFKELYSVNVNEYVEKKNGLSYLTWSYAWAEIMKRYPTAKYEIVKFNGLPYVYDEKTGYMVFTRVCIDDIEREMWLPVMDSANKAMKAEPYTVTNKWGKETTVEAATMFDINKTIMRCLVKNLAMFGLGLYIYAGEDLPEDEEQKTKQEKPNSKQETPNSKQETPKYADAEHVAYIVTQTTPEQLEKVMKTYNLKAIEDISPEQAAKTIRAINKRKAEENEH